MKTWRLSETIEERDYFSNSFKGEIFLFFHCFEGDWEMLIPTQRRERDRGGGIDYQYFCGTRRQFITDSQKWSLLVLNEGTSLRLGERIKMVVWSVLQDKVRTGREVGRRVQMSERATQSQNKTRNRNGEKKCKACLVCILLLLLSQLQLCHLQVFIRFLLN